MLPSRHATPSWPSSCSRPPSIPRLTEPLRLLAEIGTSDTRTLGAFYAGVPDALSLRLVVRPLSDGEDARYDRAPRRVTIAESLIAEDPRLVAVVLVHELRHATDLEWVSQGAVALDCLELEARGFEAEAIRWHGRSGPMRCPDATDRERDLAAIVEGYEAAQIVAGRPASPWRISRTTSPDSSRSSRVERSHWAETFRWKTSCRITLCAIGPRFLSASSSTTMRSRRARASCR